MNNQQLICALAHIVVTNNLSNYRDNHDPDEDVMTAKEFKDYGVNEDTVRKILKGLIYEVLGKVEDIQEHVAYILFPED